MGRLKDLEEADFCARLWKKDPTLWKMEPDQQEIISNSMGWLDSPVKIRQAVADLTEFAAELKKAGFRHVLLMGMGGSSLAPLVLSETFGRHAPGLPLTVSTPQIRPLSFGSNEACLLPTLFLSRPASPVQLVESRSLGRVFF